MRENGADRDSRADCLGYWTASLRTLPGRNFGCELALICIGSPVRGLRPVEALRRVTEKLPNPTSRTSSPRFRVDVITSSMVSTARMASLRLSPARSATWPISSCLFIGPALPHPPPRLARAELQPLRQVLGRESSGSSVEPPLPFRDSACERAVRPHVRRRRSTRSLRAARRASAQAL